MKDIASYISIRAQSLLTSSVKLATSALCKFLLANLNPTSVLDHPTLAALATGLENIPHQPHHYCLTMTKEALALIGHVLHLQAWQVEDKVTLSLSLGLTYHF